MRLVVTAVLAVAVCATPAAGAADDWAFKTPGEAAYCRQESAGRFACVRPSDGFWIRLTRVFGTSPDVRHGTAESFRGLRDPEVRVLGFGQTFLSSDAAVITCFSRRTGLTCRLSNGLSFSLGRNGTHRIFYGPAGFPPDVQPLFRTRHDIRCGIAKSLEPSIPLLSCWRPGDGLVLTLDHHRPGARGGHGRNDLAVDFRPSGFRLLAADSTFIWRCRRVTGVFADRCSTRSGEPVFTCTSTRARLTCRNRNGHGFWASARSFYVF